MKKSGGDAASTARLERRHRSPTRFAPCVEATSSSLYRGADARAFMRPVKCYSDYRILPRPGGFAPGSSVSAGPQHFLQNLDP